VVPVVASNRVGREDFSGSHIVFYGSSFIAGQTGEVLSECSYLPGGAGNTTGAGGGAGGAHAPREGGSLVGAPAAAASAADAGSGSSRHLGCDGEEGGGEVILHTFDLESIRLQRAGWGLFRDRRPSLYQPLFSLDGKAAAPT